MAEQIVDPVLAGDLPVAISHLNDIKNVASGINQMVQNIIARLKNKELPMENGMSFFDVKNQLLINYLMNLSLFILKKCSGESIKGNLLVGKLLHLGSVSHDCSEIF